MAGRSSWISEYVWISSIAHAVGITASIVAADGLRAGDDEHGPEALAAREDAVAHRLVDGLGRARLGGQEPVERLSTASARSFR